MAEQIAMTSGIEYRACAVQYSHDPAAGERLNIGVILYAPAVRYLGMRVDHRWGRLAAAFPGFEGEGYAQYLSWLERRFAEVKLLVAHDLQDRAGFALDEVLRRVVPDQGLALAFGVPAFGLTDNPAAELEYRFSSVVPGRTIQPDMDWNQRRLWDHFAQRPLARELAPRFGQLRFESDLVDHQFEHAYRNGTLNVIQPLSLARTGPAGVARVCERWFGLAMAIARQDPATWWFLVEPPQGDALDRAWGRGVALLGGVGRLYDREQADRMAADVAESIGA